MSTPIQPPPSLPSLLPLPPGKGDIVAPMRYHEMDRGDPTFWKPTRISTDEHPAYQRRDAGGPRYDALSSVLSSHWFRRVIRRRAGHIYKLPSGRQLSEPHSDASICRTLVGAPDLPGRQGR